MTGRSRGALSLRLYYVAASGLGGIYLPLFPAWLEARGMRGLRLGVIAAAAPGMAIVAPAAFGALADALGLRGGMLRFACAGALVCFGGLAVAAAADVPLDLPLLLPAALAIALFRSPMGFVADVVAVELAPRAGTTYGRIRLWGSLGFAAAVPLGARLVDPRAPAALPAVAAAFVLGALLASSRLPARAALPSRAARRGAWHLLAEGDFRLFLAAVLLGQSAQAAYDLCFSLRLFDLGIARTSPAFALAWDLGTLAEVLVMAFSAPLFRAFSAASLFAFALGCAAIRWSAIAVVRRPAVLLALQPLHALSFGLVWLASVSYASQRFPAHSIARAQGLFATAVGAGAVAGMLVWGPIYERSGGGAVFAGASFLAACACACAVALRRAGAGRRPPAGDGSSVRAGVEAPPE